MDPPPCGGAEGECSESTITISISIVPYSPLLPSDRTASHRYACLPAAAVLTCGRRAVPVSGRH
jgi:hypothetical protein